jgi:hypothetical protein
MVWKMWYLAMHGRAPSTEVRVKTRRAARENLFEAVDREGDIVPVIPITGADTTEGGGIFSRSCSRSFSIIFATITDGGVWDGPNTRQHCISPWITNYTTQVLKYTQYFKYQLIILRTSKTCNLHSGGTNLSLGQARYLPFALEIFGNNWSWQIRNYTLGCAIAQVVSHWLPITAAWVQYHVT